MPRTRSTAAHKKVLEAAIGLFAERGIDATSMDSIAETSGVSKATIYKHWPDKDCLCLEVLSYLHGLEEPSPVFDSGDLRADLIAQLRYEPAPENRSLREKMLPHLIAYAARHSAFGTQWKERVTERPRARLKQMMERGILQGRLAPNINLEVGLALLLGPLFYRRIVISPLGGSLPKDFERHVVDAFWGAYAVHDARPRRKSRGKDAS